MLLLLLLQTVQPRPAPMISTHVEAREVPAKPPRSVEELARAQADRDRLAKVPAQDVPAKVDATVNVHAKAEAVAPVQGADNALRVTRNSGRLRRR